ncbi:MAG: YceI family protein [Bryobacterales bacterium]|nr:YceI family protein [Bryobacterales bacterium]
MKILPAVAPLLVCLGTPALAQTEWRIDTAHSAAQFAVRHMMVSTVRGHFGKLTGTVRYDPASPSSASVRAEVDVASIDTREPKRDAHLKSPDFFDVEKFPRMTFQSRSLEPLGQGRWKMRGDLTIRDVTRPVEFEIEGPASPVKDARGAARSGATATAKISRKDFGITWNRALEAGGFVVGDEVTLTIDVELIGVAKSAESGGAD